MDRYLQIEIDSYGLSIDSAQMYFNLSWLGIGLVVLSVLGAKIYKKARKVK